jgi:LEA14-like dessication related protein
MRTTKPPVPAPLACALCLIVLAACRSRPAVPPAALPPPPEPAPACSARLEALPPRYESQRRLRLPFELVLSNPGRAELRLDSLDYSLAVEGLASPIAASLRPGAALPPRSEARIPLEVEVDASELLAGGAGDLPSAGWRLDARLRLAGGAGPILLPASSEGSFPVVREPRFRITSVGIGRDILVVTNLKIGLEIENPNGFPLVLDSLEYSLDGEGRRWADGRAESGAVLPARSATGLVLDGTMNFANMDRRLFDLVATLKVVRYGLKGEARIDTGLGFLPTFTARFDEAGSCVVQR